MPRARSVCGKPGCPELSEGKTGRCIEHKRPAWAGSNRRAALPDDWPRRRLIVLKRDGYCCQLQHIGCAGTATEVDHIGDRNDHRYEALRAACSWCHRVRTLEQATDARARSRAERRKDARA